MPAWRSCARPLAHSAIRQDPLALVRSWGLSGRISYGLSRVIFRPHLTRSRHWADRKPAAQRAILAVRKHGRNRAVNRRDFVTFLGGAVAACPRVARAQQPAMPVIGYLGAGARVAQAMTVLRQHLDEAG